MPDEPPFATTEGHGGPRRPVSIGRLPALSLGTSCRTALLLFLVAAGAGCAEDGYAVASSAEEVDLQPFSEAEFLPGLTSIADARRGRSEGSSGDLGWWILDLRPGDVYFLPDGGAPEWRFGGRGEGPGELHRPRSLLFWGDSILVYDVSGGGAIHSFDPRGEYLGTEGLPVPGCTLFQYEAGRELPDVGILLSGRCVDSPVQGRLVASLHRPDSGWESVSIMGEGMNPRQLFDPFHLAIASPGGDRVWFGTIKAPCFRTMPLPRPGEPGPMPTVDRPGSESEEICAREWTYHPLTEEVREQFGALDRAPVLRQVVGIPEHFPAFDAVYPHPDGILLRAITGTEARSLVLLEPDGRRWTLAERLPEHTYVDDGQMLSSLAVLDGMQILRGPLPERD